MSCFFIWKNTFPLILCFYYPASKVSIFGVILVQFFRIRNECGEIWSISPYSARMWENANQSNSEYRHFTQCFLSIPICHHFYVLDFFIFFFFTLFINNWWHLLIPFLYSVKYVQFCSETELVYEKNKL